MVMQSSCSLKYLCFFQLLDLTLRISVPCCIFSSVSVSWMPGGRAGCIAGAGPHSLQPLGPGMEEEWTPPSSLPHAPLCRDTHGRCTAAMPWLCFLRVGTAGEGREGCGAGLHTAGGCLSPAPAGGVCVCPNVSTPACASYQITLSLSVKFVPLFLCNINCVTGKPELERCGGKMEKLVRAASELGGDLNSPSPWELAKQGAQESPGAGGQPCTMSGGSREEPELVIHGTPAPQGPGDGSRTSALPEQAGTHGTINATRLTISP